MSDALEAPLVEFHADLNRLEHLLRFLGELRTFGATDPGDPDNPPEFLAAAVELRERIRGLSADFPVFSGTLLLFLAGRFEHFVRVSFESLCDSYAAKCSKFDQLPEKMRSNLLVYTAEVLGKPAKYQFDTVEARGLIRTLAQNLDATDGLGGINSKPLSITESNMRPKMMGDLYGRIGLPSIWAELGKQARLKMHYGVERDADAEREAKAELENLMSARNQVAHPSGTPSFPDIGNVAKYLVFLRVLSQVLTEVCRVHLAAYKVPE